MTQKTQKKVILISFLFIGMSVISSCKKTVTPTAEVTPTTCSQDGMIKATNFNSCSVTTSDNGGIYLTVSVQNESISSATDFKQMIFTLPIPTATGDIQLGGATNASWAATYSEGTGVNAPMYNTDETNTGVFTISSLDLTSKKMSGTFSFTGIAKPSNTTKLISGGTFTNLTW